MIATSLPYTPLTKEMQKSVLELVRRDLLTPRGLRSLAPNHPQYQSRCEGYPSERDYALHQGSAWPWLVEHYCTGYLRLFKLSGLAAIKKVINDFEATLLEQGIGSISEVFDGNPPYAPREAISYAPSVAALLNTIDWVEHVERNNFV